MFRSLRPALFLALALTLAFGTGCAGRARESLSLYEAGDYAGAARSADQGLAQHPNDEDLWGMRIRAALAQGDAPAIATAWQSYTATREGESDKALARELAIATLSQALASPSVKMKIVAIQAIEAAEIQALADRVAERMEDDDDRVVAAAAIAIIHGGYQQAAGAAQSLLASDNAEARAIVIEGIGRKVGALALDDIEKAASDPDARVRRVAIRFLGSLRDANAVALLTRRMKDPDESVRAAAASALARIGAGDLVAAGKQALADHSLAMRLAGIELYVAAKQTDALLPLAESDPDATLAVEAAIAVRRPELATRALDRAAADERFTIRRGAANLAVRAVGKEAARGVLGKLAKDPEPGVRLAAARALLHSGDAATAVPILVDALGNVEFAISAAQDLAAEGNARGFAVLDATARDANADPALRLAAVIAHRGAHRITPGLVAALADPNGLVRAEAAAALVALAK